MYFSAMKLPTTIEELQKLLLEVLGKLSALEEEVSKLRKENAELRAENTQLRLENTQLKAENAELRRRLGLHSGNSHKPPSSDGYKKKKIVAALPKEAGKRQGGQIGHQGKTLEQVDKVDKELIHHAEACRCCGRKFSEQEAYELLPTCRQVFDIPEPRLEVIAHRISGRFCCGQLHLGHFPEGVSAPVQYGLRAKTFMSLLNVDYRLPYQKISQWFADMYGYALNEGTIVNANEGLYERSAGIEAQIKAGLQSSAVVHADETGGRVAGELHWFHTVCNELWCYLFVHSKRGKEALASEASLFPFLQGYVVHDCWSSYFSFDTCKHALCNAHLLRELKALSEQGSQWAGKMSDFLLNLYQASQQGKGIVADFEVWKQHYEEICQQADREEPPPEKTARGKPKNSKGRNLLNRLTTYQTEVLAFAYVKEVPFTNNIAEQAIRGIKIKQKVAMCFRTLHGAEVFARLQGVMTTLRKQGLNLFQTLLNINAKINVQLGTT